MKEYIGKNCKIHVNINDNDLFYTAHILDVSDNHISFSDKFNQNFVVRISNIVQMTQI